MTEPPAPPRRLSRLAVPPGQAAVRHYDRALRAIAAGDKAGAEAEFRRALTLDPGLAEAHTNLGNLLDGRGDHAGAVSCYRQTLALGLWHPLVLCNLGRGLKRCGDDAGARRAYALALVLDPACGDALNGLGGLGGSDRGEDAEPAVVLFRRAVAVAPGMDIAHGNLAGALYRLHQSGATERAAAHAAAWLDGFPDHPMARHIGAVIAGRGGEERASDGYVRTVFDQFAAEFETTLGNLGYCAPERLAAAVAGEGITAGAGLTILDAGCGTGLCAPFLRPAAARLDGVDLSAGMLERARACGLYDGLEEAELGAFLIGRPGVYDVIVAADVLCYFGVLEAVLAAARGSLRPGGLLAFTVERWGGNGRYRVNPHGRYAHAPSYVVAALAGAGLAVSAMDAAVLRHEGGQPVTGLVVTARA